MSTETWGVSLAWGQTLYRLFDVLPKQTLEMKTFQIQVYIQQRFHGEQGAKFI